MGQGTRVRRASGAGRRSPDRGIDVWASLLCGLVAVPLGAGCQAKCRGLAPQAEVSFGLAGDVDASLIKDLRLTLALGDDVRQATFPPAALGSTGRQGRFVLQQQLERRPHAACL